MELRRPLGHRTFHAPENVSFDKELPETNFSVAALLETHHKNEDDFPDLIREYIITHHCNHTPTPHDHKHSGIIILISKNYEILHSEIKMPGRMVNLQLSHRVTKHEYNLTVYYALTGEKY